MTSDATANATLAGYALPDERDRRLWLTAYHRDGASSVALEPGDTLVVGRTAPADLVIDDVSLSRRHARIERAGDVLVIADLGSTNGTWCDGERIEQTTLAAGREVVLGSVVCAVHTAQPQGARVGLMGHDRFMGMLERELARARFFDREVALIMVRGTGDGAHAQHWSQDVLSRRRDIDAAGLYSGDTVELLAPELPYREAIAWAEALLAGQPHLRAAVASFPRSASAASSLLGRAHRALDRTTRGEPLGEARAGAMRPLDHLADDDAPIARSSRTRETLETAQLLARGVIPVLLEGETGVGKEVVARYIHDAGPRKDAPLIAVNCGALAPQLVESTLFGHEKGAFTGATQQRQGVFEAARGGTLFLDEIGELPPEAQASLLRVLETKRITRVGGTKEVAVDVRIIAATHRDLEAMADDGHFRKDLLYRLNAMTLRIPPLRSRREDIGPLTERFLARANRDGGGDVTRISPAAQRLLASYEWPGNVRELRNAIDRGVAIARHGAITPNELPERVRHARPSPEEEAEDEEDAVAPGDEVVGAVTLAPRGEDEDFRSCMERLETAVIVEALEAAGWNKAEAARRMQMPRRTLVHRIKALGIAKPDSGE